MTPVEYVHRRTLYERYTERPLGTMLVAGAFFVAVVPFLGWVLGITHPLAFAAAPLAWIVAARIALARRARRRAEALGLVCRTCGAALVGWRRDPSGDGHCRRCGAHVLDPAAPPEPERALFTRVELVRRQARASRFGSRLMIGWLGILWGCLLLAPAAWHVLPPYLRSENFVYGCFIVFFFVSLVAMTWLGGTELRSAGMACPVCGASFVEPVSNFTLLKHGRCPQCDLLVVDEGVDATASVTFDPRGRPPAPAAAAEYAARAERLERGTQGEYAVIGAVSTAALGTATLLILGAHGKGSAAFYGWLLVGLLVAMMFPVWGEHRWEARARSLGLTCPSCGELLVGGKDDLITRSVLHDGRCMHCGTRLWSVGNPPPPPG